ncbi:uncharacterized protein [Nicotiana sylvestris]|uniref:uncharacterized protein n=1 Tax=Nicotiana sylvestris TaxID=4096 RepID=UPI00388CDEBB
MTGCNITPPSVEISMKPQEKKGMENMLSIASKGVVVEEDDTTGVPSDEPYPFANDPGQGSSPQDSVDPAPSPHFYVEPLNMVVPEINYDSEEDTYDLQKGGYGVCSQEESKEQKKEKDDKGWKSYGADTASSEKLVKNSGDRSVKESGDKSNDEQVEKSCRRMQKKSVEKGKSIRKSVKRKMDDDEEPSSIKKAKVSESLSSGKRKLKNHKVLWGRTFASNILELAAMR